MQGTASPTSRYLLANIAIIPAAKRRYIINPIAIIAMTMYIRILSAFNVLSFSDNSFPDASVV